MKNYLPEITSKDDPAHLKKWMRQHYFDLQNSYDLELIRTLRKHKDLNRYIPALPQGMRFLPIVKTLDFERKLQIL